MTTFEPESQNITLTYHIRVATQHDVPKLEWYGQYAHFRNLIQRAYREQLQGRRIMLIADCNDFPIGQIFIQMKSNNQRIADGTLRGYLYSFRVMEMFQGHGIGTHLIHVAESELIQRNFHYATIAVAKENHGALRLYERLAYKKIAQDAGKWSYTDHKGVMRKVNEPCWILEKKLIVR